MTSIDTERLLRAVAGPEPAGPNLEYTPEFAELERAALGVPEQRMGASARPAQAPDFERVLALAPPLLERSKDLRIAMHLLVALRSGAGLPGFLQGLQLIRRLLERFWDGVHPRAHEDDDPECEARRNALAALSTHELVRKLGSCTSLSCPARGAITLEALASAAAPAAESDAGRRELAEVLAMLTRGTEDLAAVSQAFSSRGMRAPDTDLLETLLANARCNLERAIEPASELMSGVESSSAAATPASTRNEAASNSPRARIHCREDVLSLLEEMRLYYLRHEPSSPVPLLLERCQRLATLDFMALIQDLAPEALAKLEIVAGAQRLDPSTTSPSRR